MTKELKELFEAFRSNDKKKIECILEAEKERIKQGLPPQIDKSAQDGEADEDKQGWSVAHYAANLGVQRIIDLVVTDLCFDLDLLDKKGKKAENYAWERYSYYHSAWINYFSDKASIRKTQEAKQKKYKERLKLVEAEEKQIGGYQSGIIFTNDFNLVYSSKKPDKICKIPDTPDPAGLSIHDKQAISEAYLAYLCNANQNPSQSNIERTQKFFFRSAFTNPNTNFLLASIGCVMSDKKHEVPGDHKRIFESYPIYLEEERPIVRQGKHSESIFIEYIKQSIDWMVDSFLNNETFAESMPRKIYALVFDLHSSQDVCDDCENAILDFQNEQTQSIKKILTDKGFHVPKDLNDHFKIIFRISSSNKPSRDDYRKSPENRDESQPLSRIYTRLDRPMDLKCSDKAVIIHSDNTMREQMAKWYEKESYDQLTLFKLPKQTIFRNKSGIAELLLPESIPTPDDIKVQGDINTDSTTPIIQETMMKLF